MITILDTLKAITNYPIPRRVFETAGLAHGLCVNDTATQDIMTCPAYLQVKAAAYDFLSTCPPSISEQGISISFGEGEKREFRRLAKELKAEAEGKPLPGFGYWGDSL